MNQIVQCVGPLPLVLVSLGLAACASGAAPSGEDPSSSPGRAGGAVAIALPVMNPASLEAGSSPPPADPPASDDGGTDDAPGQDAPPEASAESGPPADDAAPTEAESDAGPSVPPGDASPMVADSAPPPGCPPSTTSCGGQCVNTASDVANCGQCGAACTSLTAGGHAVCAGGSCASECAPGYVVCAGACVDPSSDPDNCGACGTGCAPGSCSGGACQPWPVVENVDDWTIACDGAMLTWSAYDSSQVLQAAADGGQLVQQSAWSELTASNPGQVSAMVAAGGTTVWTGTDPTGATQALYQSSAPRTPGYVLVTNLDPTLGLAVDANAASAYFATTKNGQASIWQCDIAGSTPSCLALATFTSSQIGAVAVDDQAVYWTDPTNGWVSRYVFADANVSSVADGQRGVGLLAVDANRVYWTTSSGSQSSLNALLKGASTPAVLATTDVITALAVDGVAVYFADGAGVESVPAAGGKVATLATKTPAAPISQIVYASGSIYFHQQGGGTVRGLRTR